MEGHAFIAPQPRAPGRQGHERPQATTRRRRRDGDAQDENAKRRCVSTACIACRKRKSKCDGNLPACSSCASVYDTECVYDPNSDHRRKGVYKKDIDKLKTRNSTLEVLIQAILNHSEDEVASLITSIRTCDSLDAVAEAILAKEAGLEVEDEDLTPGDTGPVEEQPAFEKELSGKMGGMRFDEGVMRYIGGTSHLIFSDLHASPEAAADEDDDEAARGDDVEDEQLEDQITSWTIVTTDRELILHLMNMYFAWHWEYFACVPKALFYQDFLRGTTSSGQGRRFCTPLLVNAMLALGCHFTARPGARLDPDDPASAGDHFFKEAKRQILENDEHEKPSIPTVQALALMSVREAGCGREAKGWVYSGMSFRMACDLGLNLAAGGSGATGGPARDDLEEDARRITFWGCFQFDKCWSNYLGRLPQLPRSIVTIAKVDVFPTEDSESWAAYTDSGFNQSHAQPSRTRAVARQTTALCEISGDLMSYFYNPTDMDKTKGKQAELKKLSDIHQRLEGWRRDLPKEFEPKEGLLPSMLVAHMFFQLLYIHLFRPFLKYAPQNSPLPSNVSPRKLCTTAAASISKLLRLYKRSHGLRQICNIAVYITQSACTIHLLNLPDKNAKRDITHGLKHLEEIADSWLCAKRTLSILSVLSKKWEVELPEEAEQVLSRCEDRFGPFIADYHTTSHSNHTNADGQARQSVSPQQTSAGQLAQAQAAAAHTARSSFTPASASTTSTFGTASPTTLLPPPATAHDLAVHPRSTLTAAQTPGTTSSTPRHGGRVPSRLSVDSVSRTGRGTPAPSAKASPSDMFGGVDQLLRTSAAADNGRDWLMRDQSQLAVGFGNWADTADWFPQANLQPAAAAAAAASSLHALEGGAVGRLGHVPMGAMEHANAVGLAGLGHARNGSVGGARNGVGNGHGPASGQPLMSGLDVGYHGVLGYDDSAWYS